MAQRAFGKGKATRVFLALLLAFSLVGIGAVPAAADPADDTQAAVDAAQATLDEAESRMAQINSEYEQLTAEVAELQTKIDETAAAAMEAQQAMLEGRAALGQVAVGEYRDGSSMGLLGLILDSKNFDELLRNMEYVTQIMSYQADEVAEQKERKRAFDDVSDELNAQKNEQEEALAAQEAKRAEAQSVVEDATGRLEGAQEEHAARLAELAAQAEALRKQEEEAAAAAAAAVQESPDANTGDREPVVSDDEGPSDNGGSSGSSGDSGSSGSSGNSAAPAAPATGADPAARRRKGGFRRGLGLRRFHRSVHAEPRHHVHRRRLRRQLHGRGGAQIDAELPQLFRTYGGNRLRRSDRVCHGERLRLHGRRFPRPRSAAGRVEGLRLLQLPRLGPAHRQVPLPVGRPAVNRTRETF
ncbi:MAG: coiled-coil domain-containing protein [Adlercreutzia sp.]